MGSETRMLRLILFQNILRGFTAQEQTCYSPNKLRFWNDLDFFGGDINGGESKVDSKESCMIKCINEEQCNAFTYDNENRYEFNCWLKHSVGTLSNFEGVTSGVRCNLEEPKDQADGEYPEPTCYSQNKLRVRCNLEEPKDQADGEYPVQAKRYIGCYEDREDRDFNFLSGYFKTPQSCVRDCSAQGFIYAAVQDGGQCFCGDSYGKYGKIPETNCMQPCKTDNSVTCGGAWSNSVYETAPECEQEVTVTYNGPIDIQPEIVGVYIQTGQVEQNRVVYKHELKETYLFTSPNKNWHIHSEVGKFPWIY